jgi:hypothetical protein
MWGGARITMGIKSFEDQNFVGLLQIFVVPAVRLVGPARHCFARLVEELVRPGDEIGGGDSGGVSDAERIAADSLDGAPGLR